MLVNVDNFILYEYKIITSKHPPVRSTKKEAAKEDGNLTTIMLVRKAIRLFYLKI